MRSLRLLAAALIVPASLFIVAPAHAATITVCAVGCDHTTIQLAVTAAEATPASDTITVEAGTYPASLVKITKPVTIVGDGPGSTTLDGGALNKQIFDIRPAATGSGEISISGMTLTNAGTATYAIYTGIKQATTEISAIEFDDLVFNNSGTTGYGIYVDSNVTAGVNREAPPLSITDNTFIDTKFNNIGVDSYDGAVTISGNTLREGTSGNSAIFVGNEYTPNRLTGDMVVTDNTSTGRLFYLLNSFGIVVDAAGYDSVSVTDNDISGLSTNDPGIFVGSNSVGVQAADPAIDQVEITGNTIRGDVGAGSSGVTIRGLVNQATIAENDIVGVVNGVNVIPHNGDNPDEVNVHRNRLFANTNGVSNSTTADVDATENWWGCQTDPLLGGSFCSDASNTGSGSIDVDPWVVTTAALGSNSILAGASTSIDTDLGHLSDGSTVALPSFFAGLTSAFAATAGTVNPTAGTLDGSFADSSNYTAPLVAGPQTITVAIDEFNGQTGEPVELPITITALPIDNGGGGSGGPDPDDGGVGGVGGVDDDSALPDTGTSTPEWLIFLSTFAVMLGALVVWSNRTRRPAGRHILT